MNQYIIEFLNTEIQINDIKKKICYYKKLLQILDFDYNIQISHKLNYEHYEAVKKIPNMKINSDFFNKIHILNQYSQQKLDLEFMYRIKYKHLISLKNYILDYITKNNIHFTSIKKYKSNRNIPTPTKKINKPEQIIYDILLNFQKNIKYNKHIILIIPQYTLPVKYKKNLYSDFFVLIHHNNTIFPIIIEFDGDQHFKKHFFFSKQRIYADIIKNNFAITNCLSIIRCKSVDKFYNIFINCIQHIITNNTPFYSIPDYNTYIELINLK